MINLSGHGQTPGSVRRISYFAVLTAAAFVLSAAESMIPVPVPAPGFKLGLANTVTLIVLINEKNPLYALVITIIRCILTTIILGAFSSLLFSLAGGIFSCIVMWFLLRLHFIFSVIGASVGGAITHNMAQLSAAALIARDTAVYSYMPILLAAGMAAGFATGFIAVRINRIIKIPNKL